MKYFDKRRTVILLISGNKKLDWAMRRFSIFFCKKKFVKIVKISYVVRKKLCVALLIILSHWNNHYQRSIDLDAEAWKPISPWSIVSSLVIIHMTSHITQKAHPSSPLTNTQINTLKHSSFGPRLAETLSHISMKSKRRKNLHQNKWTLRILWKPKTFFSLL